MLLCLRKPPVRFLWCCCSSFHFWSSFCCCSSFVDVLIHIFFSTSSLTIPWTIAWFLHPFYTFSPAHSRVIRDTFILNYSIIFLPRALRPWVGIFYLMLLHQHFNLRLSRFPGSRQFFLEVWRTSYRFSKHKPSPSLCLIHSNQQSSYSERFSFKLYHILSWIACGESLIYLLLTCFKLFLLVQSHM